MLDFVLFHFSDAPRVMITPSSPHTVVVGNLLRINCSAIGLPIPTVQWFRNGVAVTPLALKSLQYSEAQVRTQQNVVFTCAGTNYAGNKTIIMHANIIVNIIGKQKCYDAANCVFSHPGIKCHHSLKEPANGRKAPFEIGGIQYISFTCDPGYSIEGGSLAKCMNGKWSHSTPKCV